MTEEGGTATIPAGETEIQVAHGCGGVPNLVLGTPQDNLDGRDYKADEARVDATNLYIEISDADLVDHKFWWYGKY